MVSLLFHDVYARNPGESGFCSPAADRYKLTVADFDAQLSGLAEVCQHAPVLVRKMGSDPIFSPKTRELSKKMGSDPIFLLTFDDGGVSYYTVVADRLEALGWRGHCFVSTNFIGSSGFLDARQLRELDARGHLIGGHSASHPTRFSACTPSQMIVEWTRSRRTLEDLLGHPVTSTSLPGGYFSEVAARTAADAGIQTLFTSEPSTALHRMNGCVIAGRFPVRCGSPQHFARALVMPPPWTRYKAWAEWNAKALIKPLLGSSYPRVADWLLAARNPVNRT